MIGCTINPDNGAAIHSFEELQQSAMMNTGVPMRFGVDRAGVDVAIDAAPQVTEVDQGALGKRKMGHLGLFASTDPKDVAFQRCSAPTCALWGAEQVWFIFHATNSYVVGLFAGRESADQVSGVIGAAQMAGEMAKVSLWELLSMAALFSVSIGYMNLLPVPLLDGGHLMYYALEALRGRPLSERIQEFGLKIGIALVALLVIFTTSHDIFRLVAGAH